MVVEAGKGEHHYYWLTDQSLEATDTAPLEARKHYLGVDVVHWYINKQGNILSNRIASGTVQLALAEEIYEVGLGTYQLEGGARTAPVFDRPILANRVFLGGRITIRVFMRTIQQDTLLGSLLRDMAKASIDVVTGAVGAATATGPTAVLMAAATSMVSSVKKILNEGKNGFTIFDPNGLDVTVNPASLRGAATYLLLHRGTNLIRDCLTLEHNSQGILNVFYDKKPLEDGAWILLRLRREDEYGMFRPWEQEARSVRTEIDNIIDTWLLGGIKPEQIQQQLVPLGSDPLTVGDKALSVVAKIRSDYVLAEREAIKKAGQLRSLLLLAQEACRNQQPQIYVDGRAQMEESLRTGVTPPALISKTFLSEAQRIAGSRGRYMTLASPDLVGEKLWRSLRYIGDI